MSNINHVNFISVTLQNYQVTIVWLLPNFQDTSNFAEFPTPEIKWNAVKSRF
jgi:hypothetical protein